MQLFNIDSEPDILSKIKIIVRIRPTLSGEEKKEFIQMIDKNTLNVLKPGNNFCLKFSSILSSLSKQQDVFTLTKKSVYDLLNGITSTIFAYGQSGAGKTYTIIGDDKRDLSFLDYSPLCGILIRTLELLINELKNKRNHSFKLFLSFFEVYNEKIYDLFSDNCMKSNSSLLIRGSKNSDSNIPDLKKFQVSSFEECIKYLQIGLNNRSTGSTFANANSSRSHSVFQISLHNASFQRETKISSLQIVDLAGSEKFQMEGFSSEEKKIRIQELISINGSLSCLGQVVTALTEKSRKHIPFRNSKLTRVLSDSLSGNGKIYFIICISPSISSSSETLSTLEFASRVKKMVLVNNDNNVVSRTNKENVIEELKSLKFAYNQEKLLREEYERIIRENSQNEFVQLREENQQLKEKIKQFQKIKNYQDQDLKQNKKFTRFEKNQVLTKIKQSDLRSSKSILEIPDHSEDFNFTNSFDDMQSINETGKLKQKMLNVSPSRNYLLNLESLEKETYEYLEDSTIMKKRKSFSYFEKSKKNESIQNRYIGFEENLKDEMDKALSQLNFLKEKDKNIKMKIK